MQSHATRRPAIPDRQPAKHCVDGVRLSRQAGHWWWKPLSPVPAFSDSWKQHGRRATGIVLHYASVDSPEQALIRIRNRVVLGGLELTRIRGHLTLWGGGIHHAEIKTAVRAGVPAPDG